MRTRIGEYLLQAGLIDGPDLARALGEHERSGAPLGAVLTRLGLVTEAQIARALAAQLGFPYLTLADDPPDPAAVVLIPKQVSLERACIAMRVDDGVLTVAMADPLLFRLVQDLEFETGLRIKEVVSARTEILDAIRTLYPDTAAALPRSATPETASATPLDDIVRHVIDRASASVSSDVHIEPLADQSVVRHRLDGMLQTSLAFSRALHQDVIARVKTLAGMDSADTRLPQTGRIRSVIGNGSNMHLRVSTLPTIFGERLVLRTLDRSGTVPPITELGLSAAALDELKRLFAHGRGLLLVAAPRRSGRTTTLCSAARALSSPSTVSVLIDDPVEYVIPRVAETDVGAPPAAWFPDVLRAAVRQEADVIVAGDLPDLETALAAVAAARAGRLVLAGLSADTAVDAITKLTALGVDPALGASALTGVVAQRLVRRLCPRCRRPAALAADTRRLLGISDLEAERLSFFAAAGCDQCDHTGYRGRIGLFEVLTVTDPVRQLIGQRASADVLHQAALGAMATLADDGLLKIKTGVTTAGEVLRVLGDARDARASCPRCGALVAMDASACPRCGKDLSV